MFPSIRVTVILFFLVPGAALSDDQGIKSEPEEVPETVSISIEDFVKSVEQEHARELTPEQKYLRSIQGAVTRCRKDGGIYLKCWSKASPAKCESLLYEALAEKGEKMRAWRLCVSTCADAGYSSKTSGECRSELPPVANKR